MRQTGRKNQRQRPSSLGNIQKFKVSTSGPLLEVAGTILKDHTPTKVKSMLKHHQFAVNGTPSSQFDRPVNAGDELSINFDGSFRIFSHPKIKLIYEDNDIMIVDKGCSILSTAAAGTKDDTVFNVMRKYVKAGNEHAHIYVVHRLDRDTSGLMLLTRTAKARDTMLKNWTKVVTERKYEAIVEGAVKEDRGLVQNYLTDADNYEVVSSDNPEEGVLAKTRYVVLDRTLRYSRVELSLTTGHKNQLRVHMKDLGHPISGDSKYGARSNGIHRLALHATRLGFIHPVTGKEMHFESPVPASFITLLKT